MMKYCVAARRSGVPAASNDRVANVKQVSDTSPNRQASIAEALVAALGRTMALAYSQRQGWDDVRQWIALSGCNPQDT